ncbi:YicC/YloC family endoribonuclease [Coralloluteibacterium stylophorae]|uniref:YicC family protein n=1 Tax=Coralloluteibacterium stylophorae TaxID=1776034 RepID=A0A8J8B0U9_9GAMM|nr:YicC/YloC family endoribonuclease [Coralloluteibacterium stylophorae]MBS7458408.1 YicC family protein [Coralloluteibacterium stylophorae]
MIRSMTAFASGERATAWGTLGCELRAVNHRFLELGVRLPEELRALEPALRERVGARVSRGKVDLTLRLRAAAGHDATLAIDEPLVDRLAEICLKTSAKFPGQRVEFMDLLRFPGVVVEQAPDLGGLQAEALALAEEVVAEFVAAREREGEKLLAAMVERVDGIAALVAQVRGWLPDIRGGLRQKLEARLAELDAPIEPGRMEQELVLGLQKLDVDEELDRLDSHVAEARRSFALREAVGRRLDFLLQEFNREANTLGSKSVDTRTSKASVDLKVLIEQIREQVQNIE